MTAVVKKIGEKRAGFEIPTVEEVRDYMRERKKEWPEKFVEYYAEKFWCHYQSNGWKVSGKAAMKDWRAAIVSQWQKPKFKEDIDFLNDCLKSKTVLHAKISGNDKTQWLNDLLAMYGKNFESVNDVEFIRAYDYMKANKLIKLEKDEIELLKVSYGNNIEKGKAACVKMIFSKMINYGKTF